MTKPSRRVIWSGVAAVSLAVIVGAWVLSHFDRETYEARTPPGREARRDPWLAAERLLARMGWQVDAAQEAATLDRLPPGGALLLSNEREYHLTPTRAASLLDWVANGGYLIADASGVGPNDAVLRAFDVKLRPARPVGSRDPSPDDEGARERRARDTEPEEARYRGVGIPGYGRVLRMRAIDWVPLYAGERAPAWRTPGRTDRAGNASDEILEFAHGRGHVTLINGLWRFSGPAALDAEDHAEILVALLATHHVQGAVRILTRLDTPSLFEWLRDNAAAALASMVVLIAFWVWHIVPRFGVVRAPPALERRSLVEHLRAIGRFLWRQKAGAVMLDAARANVRRRLAQRGVAAADASPASVSQASATALGLSASAVADALTAAPGSPDEFTAHMQTLAEIDRRLTHLRTS
jgi:hypothetical protein